MKHTLLLVGIVALLLGLFVLRLALGSVAIPPQDVLAVLLGGDASRAVWKTIVLELRLPQALTAVLAGAALSVGGLLMQTLFRNPLADPFILGVSSGASLGVALVVLSSTAVTASFVTGSGLLGDLGIITAASAGALFVLLVVLVAARMVASGMTLLILGLLFSYMTSATVSLLLYFSIPERIQAYISWTFGSFSGVTGSQMAVVAPVLLLAIVASFTLSKGLNALLLGEAYAQTMGVQTRRLRLSVIALTAVLAGTVTAFCGPIGFIGIAVPHVCRALFGSADHRLLIPSAAIVGALVALAAALFASVPNSAIILPLNAVTAFMGAPVVIWVILSRREQMKDAFSS